MAFSEFHNTANLWLLTLAHGVAGPRGAPVLLTTGTEHVEFVAVSPDGRWLAFDSDRNGFPNLYRMRVTGSEPERLTTEATFDFAPSWSPDGEEIAFHSWRRGSRDILVIPSRGGPAQPVVQWKSHEFYPDWSPDGRTLVFESDRTGRRELYLVARDSAGKWDQPRQLTRAGLRRGRGSPMPVAATDCS
jgi:Tol biopolymer transport system component